MAWYGLQTLHHVTALLVRGRRFVASLLLETTAFVTFATEWRLLPPGFSLLLAGVGLRLFIR